MKKLMLVAATAVGLSAFGVDYTWTGAAGGNTWKTNENWVITGTETVPEVGVWPGGGDKATIPSTASIDSLGEPPVIPEGQVLEVYRGKNLNWWQSICGAGTIKLTGPGSMGVGHGGSNIARLEVYGTSTNGGTTESGSLELLDWHGAGTTGTIYLDSTTGPQLYVPGSSTRGYIGVAIEFKSGANNNNGKIRFTNAGDVVFTNTVKAVGGKLSLSGYGLSNTYTFKAAVENSEYWFPGNGTFRFEGPVTVSTYWGTSSNTHCIFANVLNAAYFSPLNNTTFETNDVVHNQDGSAVEAPWNFEFKDNTTLNLGGFDQTLPKLRKINYESDVANAVVTSPAPAMVTLRGFKDASETPMLWKATLMGNASLTWAPMRATDTLDILQDTHTTYGDLIVTNGTVRIAEGAGFANLSNLVVKTGATLIVKEGAGSITSEKIVVEAGATLTVEDGAGDIVVDTIEVATGSTLNLATGVRLHAGGVKLDEAAAVRTRATYKAGEGLLADIISGDGIIVVSPRMAYTWNGGASGEWCDAANWTTEATGSYPNGENDIVQFGTLSEATFVTVSDPVDVSGFSFSGSAKLYLSGAKLSLGADGIVSTSSADLSISNDLELLYKDMPVTLTGAGDGDKAIGGAKFYGTISGNGGLYKTGRGDVWLYKDNPFKGRCVMLGNGYTKAGVKIVDSTGGISCYTYIYHGGALGRDSAWFALASEYGNQLHTVGTKAAPIVIEVPVRLSQGDNANNTLVMEGSDLTFNKPVYAPGRFRPGFVSGSGTLTFNDAFTTTGWLIPSVNSGIDAKIVYNGPATGGFTLYHCAAKAYFNATDNAWGAYNLQSDIYCGCENALVRQSAPGGFNGGTTIHLCGYDQLIWIHDSSWKPSTFGTSTFAFESPLTEPAQVILSQDSSYGSRHYDLTFPGKFKGAAGLAWRPRYDKKLKLFLDGGVSPTAGELSVTNGTVVLTNAASMVNLSKIRIVDEGNVFVSSDSQLKARVLEMDAGRKVELQSGVTMRVASAVVGGQILPDGDYTAGDYVTGEGTLKVDSTLTNVFAWAGSTGDFFDPTMWANGFQPTVTDTIELKAGGSVQNFPIDWTFSSLTIGGAGTTMTVSLPQGWEKSLKAESLTIGDGGVLTCDGPFMTASDAPAARVNLVVGSLTIDAGGKIDVCGKGWSGGGWNTVAKKEEYNGFGPGASKTGSWGAFHFGHGGKHSAHTPGIFTRAYDDPLAPALPGSGGYMNSGMSSCGTVAGGGAVRIVATGTVTVDGEIRADGDAAIMRTATGTAKNAETSAGSGGSVWITAARVMGSGKITANGGDGSDPRQPSHWYPAADGFLAAMEEGGAGGGGGIALEYGASQQAGDCTGMRISAACGVYSNPLKPQLTLADCDKWATQAELGTVHFSDDKVLKDTFGKGLSGRLVDVTGPFVWDGDLVWTEGSIRFCNEGADVTFNGDLTLDGVNSRLDVGGITNRVLGVKMFDMHAGVTPIKLTVNGDVTVTNGAALSVRAASVADASGFGATATVTGELKVCDGSHLYPWCDYITCKATRFLVGSFRLDEGGEVNATQRGVSGGPNDGNYSSLKPVIGHSINQTSGYSPYSTKNAGGISGSHGGTAGRSYSKTGYFGTGFTNAYDDVYRPCMAGAGGGSGGYAPAGDGGGVVYIVATGAMTVNGSIAADADLFWGTSGAGAAYCAAGAGGTIFLSGKTFAGGATATLSAKGGMAYFRAKDDYISAPGGGGRIAVWSGAPYEQYSERRFFHSDETPFVDRAENVFLGTATAAAGQVLPSPTTSLTAYDTLPELTPAGDGTIRFCHLDPRPGTLFLVR